MEIWEKIEADKLAAAPENITLEIQGMSCAACARSVEKALNEAPGVAEAFVNFATEKASVVPATADIDVEALSEAVRKAGYGAAAPGSNRPADGTASDTTLPGGATSDSQALSEERRAAEPLRRKARDLLLAAIFTVPLGILTVGAMLGMPLPGAIAPGTEPLRFGLLQVILLLPILYAGRGFFTSGLRAFARMRPNMDSLIALGTLAALAYSVYGLVLIYQGNGAQVQQLYIKSAAFILALVLLGKYLEARAKYRATGAVRALLKLVPETATRVQGADLREIAVSEIQKGDVLLIRPGARVPVDGVLIQGATHVDESMLTGESLPAEKGEGDALTGGTVNGTGSVRMRVTRVGRETTLARVIKLVEDAQATRAPMASLADRVSAWFVPAVIIIAGLSALGWFIAGRPLDFVLTIFISVLIIACPCALGLAVPAAIMTGTGRGAGMGILIRNAAALEIANQADVILFDKTGTLTRGRPALTDYRGLDGRPRGEHLEIAAAMESNSEHPLAHAVLAAAREEGVTFKPAAKARALPGMGIAGRHDGREIALGKEDILTNVSNDERREQALEAGRVFSGAGATAIFMAIDGEPAAVFAVSDTVKPDARETVQRLRELGMEPVMVTGDGPEAAGAVAAQAGIETVLSRVSPEGKAREVEKLRSEGRVVAMVGDGINDAPSLAAADLGMVMSTGSDAALESGDIVLVGGELKGAVRAVSLSRATANVIRQNLFWAFFYNVLFIPVAAGALALFGGPLLKPVFAAAAMAFSSVSVLLNALRLRTLKIER